MSLSCSRPGASQTFCQLFLIIPTSKTRSNKEVLIQMDSPEQSGALPANEFERLLSSQIGIRFRPFDSRLTLEYITAVFPL
jgi:hypothetical protein